MRQIQKERVERSTYCKGRAACKRLCEVKLCVGVVIIVVRINELDVAVIDKLRDHRHAGAKYHSSPLEYYGVT